MAKQNGNHGAQNQPQYVYYQPYQPPRNTNTDWFIILLYSLLVFSIIWTVGLFTTCSSELEEEISKEYNIPIGDVEYITFFDVSRETGVFPIPSSTWYVRKSGEKIQVASDYFGFTFLNKEAIEKHLLTDKAKSEARGWNSAWEDIDKKYKDIRSDYN